MARSSWEYFFALNGTASLLLSVSSVDDFYLKVNYLAQSEFPVTSNDLPQKTFVLICSCAEYLFNYCSHNCDV